MPGPDNALLDVYRRADYYVASNPAFTLHNSEYSAALAALYEEYSVNSAAFITACNPHSRRLSPTENRHRQQSLQLELQRLTARWLPGRGEDPQQQWPGEDSFLVLGIEKETACGLGRQFGQCAIIFCSSDAVPQLVLL